MLVPPLLLVSLNFLSSSSLAENKINPNQTEIPNNPKKPNHAIPTFHQINPKEVGWHGVCKVVHAAVPCQCRSCLRQDPRKQAGTEIFGTRRWQTKMWGQGSVAHEQFNNLCRILLSCYSWVKDDENEIERKLGVFCKYLGLLGKSWLTSMINERELELIRAFVYNEKYICLPKKKSLLRTCGLCGEHWKKAVNEIPVTLCPQPHPWLDILCTEGSRAAPVGVDGAGCSPGLIHQLLKPREPPPWWCSHAMGKKGGSLLAKVQQGRLCGWYGFQCQAWHAGVSQGLQVTRETWSVFFPVGVSAANLPQSNLESWLRKLVKWEKVSTLVLQREHFLHPRSFQPLPPLFSAFWMQYSSSFLKHAFLMCCCCEQERSLLPCPAEKDW